MLLFNIKFNSDIEKYVNGTFNDTIIIKYGDKNIYIKNTEFIYFIINKNFSYDKDNNIFKLFLSFKDDINLINQIEDYKIEIVNNTSHISNVEKLKLYEKYKIESNIYVYDIPVFVADILNIIKFYILNK